MGLVAGGLVAWMLGRLVAWGIWLPGRLVAWSLGSLVAWGAWLLGRLVAWSHWSLGRIGHLVALVAWWHWSLGRMQPGDLRPGDCSRTPISLSTFFILIHIN